MNTHFQLIEQPGGEFKQQVLAYDYKNEIENTFAKLPQAMFVLHHLQLVYDHLTLGSRQLVARATFPQTILIYERGQNFVPIHQIGDNITTFSINRVGFQIELFAQFRYCRCIHFGTLLRSMSTTLGKQVIQRIAFHHYRHTRRHPPERINTQSLLCQLQGVRRIILQPHLLYLHPEISLIQPCNLQILFHLQQMNRVCIRPLSDNIPQSIVIKDI